MNFPRSMLSRRDRAQRLPGAECLYCGYLLYRRYQRRRRRSGFTSRCFRGDHLGDFDSHGHRTSAWVDGHFEFRDCRPAFRVGVHRRPALIILALQVVRGDCHGARAAGHSGQRRFRWCTGRPATPEDSISSRVISPKWRMPAGDLQKCLPEAVADVAAGDMLLRQGERHRRFVVKATVVNGRRAGGADHAYPARARSLAKFPPWGFSRTASAFAEEASQVIRLPADALVGLCALTLYEFIRAKMTERLMIPDRGLLCSAASCKYRCSSTFLW